MKLFSKQGNRASQPAWIKGNAQSWPQTLKSPATDAKLGRQGSLESLQMETGDCHLS